MKIRRSRVTRMMVMTSAVFLSLPCYLASAANASPMTPELASKKEMVRKQEEQRITPDMRKKAAEALKAERIKVYQAKKAVQQSNTATTDSK